MIISMQIVIAMIITALLAAFSFGSDAFSYVAKNISLSKDNNVQASTKIEYKPAINTVPVANPKHGSFDPVKAENNNNRIYGKALHVSDGDTIIFQPAQGEKFKIRMYGIDAPEKSQPYGPQSTGILKSLILNEKLNVEIFNTDRYGRKVAKIYVGKQDINAEMLRLGAAWHYRYYDKSSSYQQYEDLEKYARQNRKGLWHRNNPMPPWEYRQRSQRIACSMPALIL